MSFKNWMIKGILMVIILMGVLSFENTGLGGWIIGFILFLIISAILEYFNIIDNELFPDRWSNEKKFAALYKDSVYRAYTSKDIEDNTQGIIDMMQLKKIKEKCDKNGLVDDESLRKAMLLLNKGQEELKKFKGKKK